MYSDAFEAGKFNNLIETNPERQREIARQGGKASAEAKKKEKVKQAYYGALLDVAMTKDFATPEELKDFRYYRKNKDYIKEFKRYRKQFIKWYNAEQAKKKARHKEHTPAAT